jgi:hypothetical protein
MNLLDQSAVCFLAAVSAKNLSRRKRLREPQHLSQKATLAKGKLSWKRAVKSSSDTWKAAKKRKPPQGRSAEPREALSAARNKPVRQRSRSGVDVSFGF